ncbi:uncharacterized protein LOC130200924 [Pseudoliparis swirei]|uniref:uncharacterized protein LOC130200924 n=1 Tax=Pseudoliparis swirei TaxID=2059687 RepID=UPI0024BDA576|nr:uncharacterized protein LOC130200924 [Pseudoliparis swirei]
MSQRQVKDKEKEKEKEAGLQTPSREQVASPSSLSPGVSYSHDGVTSLRRRGLLLCGPPEGSPLFLLSEGSACVQIINDVGAPQGTVLSPFLFTLYTSDFQYNTESCHLQKYSDDSAVVGCIRDGREEEYRAVVSDFVKWADENHLLNVRALLLLRGIGHNSFPQCIVGGAVFLMSRERARHLTEARHGLERRRRSSTDQATEGSPAACLDARRLDLERGGGPSVVRAIQDPSDLCPTCLYV